MHSTFVEASMSAVVWTLYSHTWYAVLGTVKKGQYYPVARRLWPEVIPVGSKICSAIGF